MTDAPAVAIVGMSGRFPGVRDIGEYWQNLRDGICSISDFGEDELLAAGVDPDEFCRTDYVPAKGHLSGADRFEEELFGFSRADAAVLDPQHRLLLETVWSALEDAGYNPQSAPARTGVYVGGSVTEHMIAAQVDQRLVTDLGDLRVRMLTDRDFLPAWVSYRFGLDGPSINVQSACSTSLTAVHLATQALLLGECDAAIAGGVCVDSVHKRGYRYSKGGISSPDGRCRPFDEAAAGTVGGNGVGVVVLRRLTDAIDDGDPIRAVIRGSAVTNDGSAKVGFTAPSVAGQTAVIVEAWSAAGLDPSAARYLEMHGTATELGDRIEVAAVAAAIGRGRARRCGIGSVKSNIGHLDAAAGVAGLIKVVLMLGQRTLVPTVNVTRPHPDLALENTPLTLVTQAAEWDSADDALRLAGVTGVGIGGSNVHVVLEEAPAPAPHPSPDGLELLPISARTEAQLIIAAGRLATVLRGPKPPSLRDVSHTLRTGRASLAARDYVLARTSAEAADALEALAGGLPMARTIENVPAEALRSMGAAWKRGQAVTWPASADGPRRVHLPTYPFAGAAHGALSLAWSATSGIAGAPGTSSGPRATGHSRDAAPVSEVMVAELLSASLGQASAGDLERSFFAAGGDSLAAVHVINRMRDDFSIDVPVEFFFEELSLRQLAARIIASAADKSAGGTLLESLLDEAESSG
jgi:acyl transferase domain-containing protein/acyl carrier protein